MTTPDLGQIVQAAVENAFRERGRVNVLIAGRTGVGKSTLINAVFQGDYAATGQGRPVTANTREITKEGVPLTIFDTRGLEMADFASTQQELERLVQRRGTDVDSNQHIHVAWLCIQEDGRRVEDSEVALQEWLARHMPVIAVVTKSRNDAGFRAEVQRLLPCCRNVVRVRALSEQFDDGHTMDPMGLVELVELTQECVPEGHRRAFAAAQKASVKLKVNRAHTVVVSSSGLAAAAGAIPIPFADAAVLVPIQVGMLAGISACFGMELSTAFLTTLVVSAAGGTAATFGGRALVGNLVKLFPGAGAIVGGIISGATAAALTATLGETYIAALKTVYEEDPDHQPSADAVASAFRSGLLLRRGK